jgi:RNA polymerase sigma-70 factor (ECF subfamily)
MEKRMASNASNRGDDFAARLVGLRPALHRYAARMVGSVLDGEDVVQEAITRAVGALDRAPPEGDAAPWLFRITHNAAIDFLRNRERVSAERDVVDDDMVSEADDAARRMATRAAMSVFMRLPPSQRGAVILKDVLGYSNEEVATILGTTLAASKAALHRGRAQLRLHADAAPELSKPNADDLARLQSYVDRFNDRDFDAIRAMLADDVRFDLVARMQGDRSSFETYFTRYAEMTAWRLSVGWVDGKLAAIVTDPADPLASAFSMIVVDWAADRIVRVRDFYHAPYALEGAAVSVLAQT